MKLRELWGIPIPGTEKAVGLKKVTKDFMGKVRTYYEPVGNKINEKKFIDTVDNLTIYIQEKVGPNSYKNIFLKDFGC